MVLTFTGVLVVKTAVLGDETVGVTVAVFVVFLVLPHAGTRGSAGVVLLLAAHTQVSARLRYLVQVPGHDHRHQCQHQGRYHPQTHAVCELLVCGTKTTICIHRIISPLLNFAQKKTTHRSKKAVIDYT